MKVAMEKIKSGRGIGSARGGEVIRKGLTKIRWLEQTLARDKETSPCRSCVNPQQVVAKSLR